MEIKWIITDEDQKRLLNFVDKYKGNNFVRTRIERNLSNTPPAFSKQKFWECLVACLLTTQQRSGPKSKIYKFLNSKPFPLNYDLCKESKDLQKEAFKILSEFGGIRRTNLISKEIETNLDWLERSGWDQIKKASDKLIKTRTNQQDKGDVKVERAACLVAQKLKGIGPKQSRNLWQMLGLTRYEIPIDSRIVKWLNKNGFPFVLSASGLSDENYYQLLMDGLQSWCLKSGVYPCVFDGAIFSSYDEEWPEGYELW